MPDPYGIPYYRAPGEVVIPDHVGPSPFATEPAYGLSGRGYWYDEPSEHRLDPVPEETRRRAQRWRR